MSAFKGFPKEASHGGDAGTCALTSTMDPTVALDAAVCRSCGAGVIGPYCQDCGQRHRSELPALSEFLREAAAGLADLDGPVWSSLRSLLAQPGALTRAFREGRYSLHVSPVKLYVLASAYYFVISRFSGGSSALFVQFTEGEAPAAFLRLIEPLMVVIVPAFGLIVMLLRRRSRMRYLAHLVFALHVQAAWFVLLGTAVALDALLLRWVGDTRLQAYDLAQTLCLVYLALAIRRAYGSRLLPALGQAFLMMVLYLALLAPLALGLSLLGRT